MKSERIRGHMDAIVLSVLLCGDSYGYEIVQQVNVSTEGALQFKEGSLYPALKRLEANGFIEGYWGTDKDTGPRRRYYTITGKGKIHFEELRKEWQDEQQIVSVFLGREAFR